MLSILSLLQIIGQYTGLVYLSIVFWLSALISKALSFFICNIKKLDYLLALNFYGLKNLIIPTGNVFKSLIVRSLKH